MQHIYVIVENGEVYPSTYLRYSDAVKAVKAKHKQYLEEQMKELHYLEDIEHLLAEINVPENVITDKSHLYIEKGINIYIHKLPICLATF